MRILYILCSILLTLPGLAQDNVYSYYDGKKWGLTNNNLDVVIKPQFDKIFYYRNNVYAYVERDNKHGLVNKTGQFPVPCVYDQLVPYYGDLILGKKNKKYELLNQTTGKPVSDLVFDSIYRFCYCKESIFLAAINGKMGFVSGATGKPVVKFVYEKASFLEDFKMRAVITRNGKSGVLDLTTGQEIIKAQYDEIKTKYYREQRKYCIVARLANGNEILFDENGKKSELVETPVQETMEETMMESVALGDAEGLSRQSVHVYNQGNGNWKVAIEKRGYNSTEILETHDVNGYDSLSELLYTVYAANPRVELKAKKNGKTGVIDINGNIIIPFNYDDIVYRSSYYLTTLDGKNGVVSIQHDLIKKPVLKKIISDDYSLKAWLVEMPDGKQGFMDKKSGKIFIPGITD